jgi:thiamine-phosphate pyrophosphorylase
MPRRCLLYYITDRTAFAADEPTRRRQLLDKIAEAARAGIDYIQLREKDLPTRELEMLAREAAQVVRDARKLAPNPWPLTPALLINSHTDVALASGANGVHLRSDDITPSEVRAVWKECGAGAPAREISPREPLIGISCHSLQEVKQSEADGATFAVFAPVFEKKEIRNANPAGLTQLREASKVKIPVLALGGVSLENAQACLQAGASGIAAIRLFQENNIAETVAALRRIPL